MGPRLPRLTLVAAVALVVGGGPLAASAGAQTTSSTSNASGSILICEATGNPSAPYVEISVTPDQLSNYSAAEGDIIPAPAGGCPASLSGPAPTETSQTSTTAAVTSTSTSTSPVTTSHRTRSATESAAATKGSSTAHLAPTNPITVDTTTSTSTTEAASTLKSLPFTGEDVSTTVVLGLLLLYVGAVLRWATARRGRRSGT